MAQRIPIREFSGLNTTGLEDGRRLDEFVNLQNNRLTKGAIRRRLGMARVDVADDGGKAMDFDGSADYVYAAIDTRVWTLGLKFSMRMILEPDVITGTPAFMRAGASTPSTELVGSGSKLVWSVWDSAATKVSVTSTDDIPTSRFSVLLTRDGANLSMTIDNGTADTNTMEAALLSRAPSGNLEIARDGTNYYNGTVDCLEAFSRVLPSNVDRLTRWPDPYLDQTCVASYQCDADANDIVKDLSRFRNHGKAISSPSEVTRLAYQSRPVWAMQPYRTRSGQQRIFVQAGPDHYIVEVT